MSEHEAIADFLREYNAAQRETAARARRQAGASYGQAVDHIDGNAWNNDPDNLRIIDPSENVRGEQ